MKYETVGAAAVVEEELPSPKLKKLLVIPFGGAGMLIPQTSSSKLKLRKYLLLNITLRRTHP